jgi:hypothetical protein
VAGAGGASGLICLGQAENVALAVIEPGHPAALGVAMPSTVWNSLERYSSKATPLALSSATSALGSSTSHPAIVCRAVPAYGVL